MWIDEEKNQQDPYNRLASNTPSVGAGEGAVAPTPNSGGTTANPSTLTPSAPMQPTQQFATVQDYLGGNKTQGEQLGQKFTSSLEDTANKEKNTIGQATNQTLGDISAGSTGFDSNLVSKAVSTPTEITKSPDNLNKFLGQWNAAYKGPSSLEESNNYAPVATAANEAKSKAEQLKSTGGQQQLLQDQFNVYGQGNKGLDQAILQTSSYYPKVQEQAKTFGSIQDYLGQQSQNVAAKAEEARKSTEQTKQQTQQAFQGNLDKFGKDITTRVGAAQQSAQTRADASKATLAKLASLSPIEQKTYLDQSGNTPAEQKTIMDYLNTLRGQYNAKPNIEPGAYYSGNPMVDVNAANVANKNDYDRAAAYQQLTGENYGGILNPGDVSKANTYGSSPTLDTNRLGGYLKNQVGAKDTELFNTKSLDELVNTVGINRNDNTQFRMNKTGIEGFAGFGDTGAKLGTTIVEALKRGNNDPATIKKAQQYETDARNYLKAQGLPPATDKSQAAQNKRRDLAGAINFVNTIAARLGNHAV